MKVEKIDSFSGHRDCVYALEKAHEKHHFFSAGGDGQVVRWNLQKPDAGELIAQVPASIYTIAFDDIKQHLWVAQNYDGIHLIDVANKQEISSLKLTTAAIFDLKFYQNTAIMCLSDGTIIVLDIDKFAVRKHIKTSDKSARSVAINPISGEFVVAFSDFSIKVFDLQDFSLKFVVQAHTNSVFTLCFSPDFRYLLSGSRDAHLKVWDATNGYILVQEIVAHLFAINHVVYSPDAQLFATCSMDKSIKVWDANTFKLLKVIDRARHAGHGTSVNKLWWSDYENQLISASDDKRISVWKVE
jgi:WD40 repeat protein